MKIKIKIKFLPTHDTQWKPDFLDAQLTPPWHAPPPGIPPKMSVIPPPDAPGCRESFPCKKSKQCPLFKILHKFTLIQTDMKSCRNF